MKQIVFFIIGIACVCSSCERTEFETTRSEEPLEDISIEYLSLEEKSEKDVSDLLRDMLGSEVGEPRSSGTNYYDLLPSQGCPEETVYLFAVKDDYLESPISVKLYSPSGNTYYVSLLRSGIYQYRLIRLMSPGRWYWRYVFSLNKLPCEPDKGSYIKDNTFVRFENDHAEILWPFSDESCWVKTCGSGCGAHTVLNGEYHAQDWACNGGSLGKSIVSPLDGTVSKVAWAPTTYGNYIEIDQEIENRRLRFRIAHLESVDAYLHQVVKAGESSLGTVGSTGNSTGPHAHCSVFEVDSEGIKTNVEFTFVHECIE